MARKRLFQRLQEFILCWPGDENLQIGYSGEVMVLPPRDTVARPGPAEPYRYPAAKRDDGTEIPGTIVLTDRIDHNDRTGGYVKLFDAAEACAWLEDTRDDLFRRGFAIVMDADEVEAAMEEGRPKYEESQDDAARAILYAELERRKRWDQKGIPAPPSSSEHKIRWAKAHLDARTKETPAYSDEDLKAALGGSLPPVEIPKNIEKPKAMVGSVSREEAPRALPVTELWGMAQSAGIKLTKVEMMRLLDGDEEFRAGLIEQIAEKQEGERAPA